MKGAYSAVLGALLAALSVPAFAAERETMSIGRGSADAKKLESFLFPEAQCENVTYQCLAVRPTTELTWGLILAALRHIPEEVRRLREGHWQSTLGTGIKGKTLGILLRGKERSGQL